MELGQTLALDLPESSEDEAESRVPAADLVVTPGATETVYPLYLGENRIGRVGAAGLDVALPFSVISAHHCTIEVLTGTYLITDQGSTSGTFLGKRNKVWWARVRVHVLVGVGVGDGAGYRTRRGEPVA